MTPLEAYDLTLEKVDELKESGIEVAITPSISRNNKDTIKKYNKPDRILPGKWVRVSFKPINRGQSMKIFETANYLGMCGIGFDTGGCNGRRDWELDWSFRYTGKEDNNWRDGRESVEGMINDMENKEADNA